MIINPKKELFVKDAPILKCQITEPSVGDGAIIANIPIKISVKALLSKYVCLSIKKHIYINTLKLT